MMRKRLLIATLTLGSVVTFTSCDKDDDAPVIPPYTIPATYTFDNVKNSEASASVAMWLGFTGYLGKSTGRQLSQDSVNYLWNNTNNSFTSEVVANLSVTPADLNAMTTVKLSARTTEALTIKTFADSMVKVSQYYNTPGGPGIAGKQGSRLFNYTGLEFNQAVAKGLMGSFAMAKIFEHLDKSKTADNNTVVAGQGTAMQHEWDMAFGYVAIPKENYIDRTKDTVFAFAGTNPNRPLAIGGYFRERGQYIKAGQKVYDAFIKGRAAIGAKDYVVRDAAIATIKEFVEKTLAAAAYAYVSSPQTGTDVPTKLHALSEGYGFVVALKYRPATSKLGATQYQTLVDIMNTNFYTLLGDASFVKLKQVQSVLSTAYGQLQP